MGKIYESDATDFQWYGLREVEMMSCLMGSERSGRSCSQEESQAMICKE